jgi:hypothetical protein
VTVQYLDLTDYLVIACEVTGLELATVVKITDVGLADSALHAPTAGFSGQDQASKRVSAVQTPMAPLATPPVEMKIRRSGHWAADARKLFANSS